MDPNPQRRAESLFIRLMVGGIALMALGFILYFFWPGNPLGIVVGAGGLLMLGLTILAGAIKATNIHEGTEYIEPNCRVMARYGVDARQNVVSSDWIGNGQDIRTYVRLYSPSRGAQEFECALPVWLQCGEGMLGQAITKGHWLCGFYPQMGPVMPPAP
jgi:hypothetical protein